MRMYLAAIWVDNAMEDKFMSISNTFHFDPNCLPLFTGYCELSPVSATCDLLNVY